MTLAYLLAGVVMAALTAYALLGGADFGGGVWDLLAWGPRKDRQRELIAHAIGPVWEANHVWLIFAVVLLFTCFPAAFARLAIDLHIPLTVALIGIVLRGSAFSFRAYGDSQAAGVRRWGRVFSIASLVTPVILGMAVGAVTRGLSEPVPFGPFVDQYVTPWLNLYCLSVGALALSAFAFLAAVYLTLETDEDDVREDFRRGALWSGVVLAVAAVAVLMLAGTQAPAMRSGPLHFAGVVAGAFALGSLYTRRWRVARIAAGALVTFLLWGWGLGQFPYLIPPDLSIAGSAAPAATLEVVTGAVVLGGAVLIPSLLYLFRVFKQSPSRSTEQ